VGSGKWEAGSGRRETRKIEDILHTREVGNGRRETENRKESFYGLMASGKKGLNKN